jgi:phosphoglycolate phosphatase-like HAD superfamily hydrolase
MLYIFDLDSTLVVKYGERPLPGVIEMLDDLVEQGGQIAVATNQAGPAWGMSTGESHYPEPRALGVRFTSIAVRIPALASAPWFVAVGDERLSLRATAYQSLVHELGIGGAELTLHISADPTWRKPEPGMLLAACEAYHTTPDRAVFVGDADTDAEAAARAGTGFVFADQFFGWSTTEGLAQAEVG